MAKRKVQLSGRANGVAVVETDATIGATVGVDVFNRDGTLFDPAASADAAVATATGTVSPTAGQTPPQVGANSITLAMMAKLAAGSFILNNTGSPATPIAGSAAQARALLGVNPTADTVLPSAITPGASPYTYQNTAANEADVLVTGGTVSLIEFTRDNATFYGVGFIAGAVRLSPADRVRVTYTVAPTMTLIPR